MATKTLFLLCLALAGCAGDHGGGADAAAHWSYIGNGGPDHWGKLDPAFRTCAEGRNQSPIDLTASVDTTLPPLAFHYTADAQDVLHNGHAIQVPVPSGNWVELEGRTYALQQFHFHAPSEHLIEGTSFPLEVHLVHADSGGALLVVGVLFEEGSLNDALTRMWTHIPPAPGVQRSLRAPISAAALLPVQQEAYRFTGSLTTPPCSEGVQWVLMHQRLTASAEQLRSMARALGHPNNRPPQPVHSRVVYR